MVDEKIGNIYPFKDLANGLSVKGIAVLRYDKRTFVYGNASQIHRTDQKHMLDKKNNDHYHLHSLIKK